MKLTLKEVYKSAMLEASNVIQFPKGGQNIPPTKQLTPASVLKHPSVIVDDTLSPQESKKIVDIYDKLSQSIDFDYDVEEAMNAFGAAAEKKIKVKFKRFGSRGVEAFESFFETVAHQSKGHITSEEYQFLKDVEERYLKFCMDLPPSEGRL